MALGIVDEPGLVVETVAEMLDDEGQHVMVGRDHCEIGAVLGLLEADELLHAKLLMKHLSGDVGHGKHIGIGEVALNALLPCRQTESFAHIVEQGIEQLRQLREPTNRNQVQCLAREPPFQACPHPSSLSLIGRHFMELLAKQRQGIACGQELLWLLMPLKGIENGRQ